MENIKHLLLVAMILVALSSCTDRQEREELKERAQLLEQQLNDRDSAFNEILIVMDLAKKRLNEIKERERLVSTENSGDFDIVQKDQIVNDIALIDQLLLETNSTIAKLSEKLEKADFQVDTFKKRIATLSERLDKQNQSIEELKKTLIAKDLQIKDLNTEVAKLSEEVTDQSELISMQVELLDKTTEELNRVFYVIGDEKVLLTDGLIKKEGGLLGIGRTSDLEANVSNEKFNKADRYSINKLLIDSKKVELVTEHPAGSYTLLQEGDIVKYLQIDNPDEFWKVSKYLVVSVKG